MDPGPPEFRALNNDVILDIILSMLKTPDLLRCRRVNQKWNKAVTSILKRRPVYLRRIEGISREYNELLNLMKNSSDFPFSGFAFTFDGRYKGKTVDTLSARKFFEKFGPSFSHLCLHSVVIRPWDLVKLLSSFLPSLQSIELGTFHIQDETENPEYGSRALETLTLPSLRRIKFKGRDTKYEQGLTREYDVTAILRTATGLQKIEGNLLTCPLNEGIFMAIGATNNWSKLSGLKLENESELNVSVYQSLALHAPSSLTQLTLDAPLTRRDPEEVRAEFVDCCRAVLVSSAETLRNLVIGRVTLPLFQIPTIFPKLKRIELRQSLTGGYLPAYRRDEVIPVTPGISGHYDKFPALQEVRLSLGSVTGEILRENFWEEDTVWSSVVKLELFCHVTPDGMKHLATTFPAVTHLVVSFSYFFSWGMEMISDLSSLREFQSVEKLEIMGILGGSSEICMDELFTGMPISICRTLRDHPRRQLCEHCSEIMRPFGGIIQLRGMRLKELVLHAKEDFYYYSGFGYPFISKVSVWYGLELLPDLRTVVKVLSKADDLAAATDDVVKKYVTIVNQ